MASLASHLASSLVGAPPPSSPTSTTSEPTLVARPLLDFLFPGFSFLSDGLIKHLGIDINRYIPLLLLLSAISFFWDSISGFFWSYINSYCICSVDVRGEDEIYNAVVDWISRQKFASKSRCFVVKSVSSRDRYHDFDSDYDSESEDESLMSPAEIRKKHRDALSYTPSFGSHHFWYKRRLMRFNRSQEKNTSLNYNAIRENISIAYYGRNPNVIKDVLCEARMDYLKKDNTKTIIYNAVVQFSGSDATWTRSNARSIRPLSTVILDEQVKKELLDDITDYLNPATRRWYANRGIPYRRGYLLYGPPGTGKSSFSLALAGHFNMKVYIVSLSSMAASEEALTRLFADLPRRCLVLLEDIDSAGLTHTRGDDRDSSDLTNRVVNGVGDTNNFGAIMSTSPSKPGHLSLSGLLNILDGVSSQEGRILIMTTNYREKLDAALIRPGRIDMQLKFSRLNKAISGALFRAIYTTFETDDPNYKQPKNKKYGDDIPIKKTTTEEQQQNEREDAECVARIATEKKIHDDRIAELAEEFAGMLPEYEFSPAELQGYLLKYKLRPEAAVAGVPTWVQDIREKKAAKEKREAKKKVEMERKRKEEEGAKERKGGEEKAKEEVNTTVIMVDEKKLAPQVGGQMPLTPPPERKE